MRIMNQGELWTKENYEPMRTMNQWELWTNENYEPIRIANYVKYCLPNSWPGRVAGILEEDASLSSES